MHLGGQDDSIPGSRPLLMEGPFIGGSQKVASKYLALSFKRKITRQSRQTTSSTEEDYRQKPSQGGEI